jgi:hypothetical protein
MTNTPISRPRNVAMRTALKAGNDSPTPSAIYVFVQPAGADGAKPAAKTTSTTSTCPAKS